MADDVSARRYAVLRRVDATDVCGDVLRKKQDWTLLTVLKAIAFASQAAAGAAAAAAAVAAAASAACYS